MFKIYVNLIPNFSFQLGENTVLLHYQDKPLKAFTEIIAVYCKAHMKHINTVRGRHYNHVAHTVTTVLI
jgi:hypothetical protein